VKRILFSFLCFLQGQNTYQGQVTFDYDGTESGVFSSTLQDSTISGFSLNQTNGDSSSFLIASVTQQDNNEFDLFLVVLQDTSYPIEPRVWEIPGEGDEDNPLSLESLVIFLPKLDSSIVDELLDIFSGAANGNDSSDVLTNLLSSLSNSLYLGLQGELEIEAVTDSSVIGSFNAVLIKPAFYFPPHTISITNGEFQFFDVELPVLNSTIENGFSPNYFEISSVYPNPFNSATNIEVFTNSNSGNASLCIVDINGKKVETIFNEKMEAGKHLFSWNSNQNPSGIYFSVLKTNNSIKTKKLMLIK
tara:strand:+ start:71 stop:982 length:912 start_codon:yes stop_codon:yes gene_type:complete